MLNNYSVWCFFGFHEWRDANYAFWKKTSIGSYLPHYKMYCKICNKMKWEINK